MLARTVVYVKGMVWPQQLHVQAKSKKDVDQIKLEPNVVATGCVDGGTPMVCVTYGGVPIGTT